MSEYQNNKHCLDDMIQKSTEFDMFVLKDTLGRDSTFSLVSTHLLVTNQLFHSINQAKYFSFIEKAHQVYKKDVIYHNDIHGADVAQFCDWFLNRAGMK